MAYQSEAQLEKQLIAQLSGQKFAPVAIADEEALEANFKAQFEAFNKDKIDKPLSDKEWPQRGQTPVHRMERIGCCGPQRGQTPVHRIECIGYCGVWLGLVYLTTYGA